MAFTISSTAFEHGQAIPSEYTCDGRDMSPPLSWTDTPPDTVSLVLIAEDPDAPMGTWTHWVMYNIPASTDSLPENVPPDPRLPNGICQGITDYRNPGYGGPCPPSGTHRYFFRLYALDTTLGLSPHVTTIQVTAVMQGHILGETELMGTYCRMK